MSLRSTVGRRGSLLQAVERRLLPFFVAQGFERRAKRSGSLSREDAVAFPFGDLRRSRGVDLEVVEIQFDKNARARFAINFGVLKSEGIDLPWKHLTQSEAQICDSPEYYRLYPHQGSTTWFPGTWFQALRNADASANEAVDNAIALYPALDQWFTTGQTGPHIRRVGYPLHETLRRA